MMRGVLSVPGNLLGAAMRIVRPASILLVPVPEAATALRAWRGTSVHPGGVPAHVTVMYPFLPAHTIDGLVEAELARITASVPPFSFRLTEVGRFPGVLYLRPVPAEPFGELVDLVMRHWPAYQPYGGQYPEFIPHVTMAEDETAHQDPERLKPLLPIACQARQVSLMTESVRGWHTRNCFPLCGTA
ncbi:2'-5' RNA ligase family protein [Streptomyces griseorubiginosus]|uniref:2'-5' RNA ligase family protein n=1 Tax=Streptomyces griseorubiginosus TaxID=67304 RepID=UPI0033A0D95B